MEIIKFSEIKEENGKTVFENNMEVKHKFPIDSIINVEIEYGD